MKEFKDIQICDEFTCKSTGQISTVTDKTANSIEMFNTANKKSVDEKGKLKGIDSKNWYVEKEFFKEFYI